ncbi:MAG: LysR substrate-binding domain-containing protein [Janthinobacterium lividum]
MEDLNDLYFFTEVVAHGGFAAASRAIGQPKSKLSRKVADLEGQLGVRLIERSTRRFRVTDVGEQFYNRCRRMMNEVHAARATASGFRDEASGTIRFSCPPGMLQAIAPILPKFLLQYPKVNLDIVSTNAPIDLIEQQVDVALRVRISADSDMSMTTRALTTNLRIMVAAPAIAGLIAKDADPSVLSNLSTLSFTDQAENWIMSGPGGKPLSIRVTPRLVSADIFTLRSAAIGGAGIAFIPDHSCRRELSDGSLERVFSSWVGQIGSVYLVFTGSRGQPPAVRAFINHLGSAFDDNLLLKDLQSSSPNA